MGSRRLAVLLMAALALCLAPFCATSLSASDSTCAVRQIEEVVRHAVARAGDIFCGEALAVEYRGTARLLSGPGEAPPSRDLALLVTERTRALLRGLSDRPGQFYVEARIDPQSECFSPSESGELCVPYRRPVFMHILRARRLP
jgi:hypothetical protein